MWWCGKAGCPVLRFSSFRKLKPGPCSLWNQAEGGSVRDSQGDQEVNMKFRKPTYHISFIRQVPFGRAYALAANSFWIPDGIFLLPRPPFQPLGFPCLTPPHHCHQLDRLVDCVCLSCPCCGISCFLLLSAQFQSDANANTKKGRHDANTVVINWTLTGWPVVSW